MTLDTATQQARDARLDQIVAEFKADFRAGTNRMIRWSVGCIFVSGMSATVITMIVQP